MNEARFLFRVYDNYNRVYVTDSLILHIKDGTRNYELFSPDAKQYTMEQCTGMEDCDGNLIFEGDKVEVPIMMWTEKITSAIPVIKYVVWDKKEWKLASMIKRECSNPNCPYETKKFDFGARSNLSSFTNCRVVGNIHEVEKNEQRRENGNK